MPFIWFLLQSEVTKGLNFIFTTGTSAITVVLNCLLPVPSTNGAGPM